MLAERLIEVRPGSQMKRDVHGVSVNNPISRELPCPNMKDLGLQFLNLINAERERVIKPCMWIVNNRRLPGDPVEKCRLWWIILAGPRIKPASVVLAMEMKRSELWGRDSMLLMCLCKA